MLWNEIVFDYLDLVKVVFTMGRRCQKGSHASTVIHALWPTISAHQSANLALVGKMGPGRLLSVSSLLQASRAHDTVYALHGILTATGLKLPKPDYSKPLEVVYWEYVCCMITQTDNRWLLEEISGIRKLPEYVSWVPDWSLPGKPLQPLVWRPTIKRNEVSSKLHGSRHSAYDLRLANRGRHLIVKGVRNDTILDRAQLSFLSWNIHRNVNDNMADRHVRPWLHAHPEHSTAILMLANVGIWRSFRDFARTKFASNELEGLLQLREALQSRTNEPVDFLNSFRPLMEIIDGDAPRIPAMGGTGTGTDNDASAVSVGSPWTEIFGMPECPCLSSNNSWQALKTISRNWPLRDTFLRISSQNTYQTLFFTASGKLGMAPYPVQTGDEVFMYQGSCFPALVRKSSSGYHQWITQASVCGSMHCDVFPEDESKLEYVTFE